MNNVHQMNGGKLQAIAERYKLIKSLFVGCNIVNRGYDRSSPVFLGIRISGVYSCTLPANGKYTVTLSLNGESTAKGHCVVKIHGVEKSTEAIIGASTMNKEGYTPNSPFAFTIETSSETVEVELQAVWGVVVAPDIEPDKTYLADAWKETNSSSEEPST